MELSEIFLLLVPFLVMPIVIIFFGKMADIVIRAFNKVASGTLLFHDYKLFFLLYPYYLILSLLMSFLIENSLLFEEFALSELEIALIALSLAFLPRVIGFTAAHEQTRAMLITILSPLLIFSLPMLFFGLKNQIIFPSLIVTYCLVGALFFSVLGEFWILFGLRIKILKKSPEYLEPRFREDVKLKPYEQDWKGLAEEFNKADIEYDQQRIIEGFEIGLKRAKDHSELLHTLRYIDYSKEASWKLISVLQEQAKAEQGDVRAAAAKALGEIGKANPDAILPTVLALAKDEDRDVRNAVAEALGEIDNVNPDVVLPTVLALVKDKDRFVRVAAIIALGEIGKANPDALLQTLQELVKDKDRFVRLAVAGALGEIGKANPDAILPILQELVKDKDRLIRGAATDALGEIGKANPDAILPTVLALAKDEDRDVRGAAIDDLKSK